MGVDLGRLVARAGLWATSRDYHAATTSAGPETHRCRNCRTWKAAFKWWWYADITPEFSPVCEPCHAELQGLGRSGRADTRYKILGFRSSPATPADTRY